MAWVALEESGEQFAFSEYGSDPGAATLVNSVATQNAGSPPTGGPIARWYISFSADGGAREDLLIRVTNQSFELDPLESNPYPFSWGSGTPDTSFVLIGDQVNTSVTPASSWEPSTFEITLSFKDSEDKFISYYIYGEDSPSTSSFLIEVWQPDPVSYNCECDDEYPTKTLAQMREYLMIRLGWGAMVSTPLPGVAVTLNSFLRDAQEQIYRQYKVFRLERFFTWQLLTGVRFYDLPDNEDVCTKKLDPRMITWVGISDGDNFWRQLVCGIKPEFYYGDISSCPTHYEIRQCIEVWPPPSSDDWKLRIKGYFGLLPLEVDTDVNTIDYEAIQLFALANAKAHYGQPDAANYMGQYRDYIGAVTAGSHHTRRYVPNTEQSYPPPLPILTGYPGDP